MEDKNIPQVTNFDISTPLDIDTALNVLGCGEQFFYKMLSSFEPTCLEQQMEEIIPDFENQ